MGEYATFHGASVKIGTCEDMYYLRFDQRHLVKPENGNVDPVADAQHLRFRFPWPDEDRIEPGSGEFHTKGYHRGLHIPDFSAPADVGHDAVQFHATAGYLVSLPCPEGLPNTQPGLTANTIAVNGHPTTIHRNGFSGAVHLVSQRYLEGRLVPVVRCGGCGTMWREADRSRIELMATLLRSEGDRNKDNRLFWHQIADRLLHGAGITAEVSA